MLCCFNVFFTPVIVVANLSLPLLLLSYKVHDASLKLIYSESHTKLEFAITVSYSFINGRTQGQ